MHSQDSFQEEPAEKLKKLLTDNKYLTGGASPNEIDISQEALTFLNILANTTNVTSWEGTGAITELSDELQKFLKNDSLPNLELFKIYKILKALYKKKEGGAPMELSSCKPGVWNSTTQTAEDEPAPPSPDATEATDADSFQEAKIISMFLAFSFLEVLGDPTFSVKIPAGEKIKNAAGTVVGSMISPFSGKGNIPQMKQLIDRIKTDPEVQNQIANKVFEKFSFKIVQLNIRQKVLPISNPKKKLYISKIVERLIKLTDDFKGNPQNLIEYQRGASKIMYPLGNNQDIYKAIFKAWDSQIKNGITATNSPAQAPYQAEDNNIIISVMRLIGNIVTDKDDNQEAVEIPNLIFFILSKKPRLLLNADTFITNITEHNRRPAPGCFSAISSASYADFTAHILEEKTEGTSVNDPSNEHSALLQANNLRTDPSNSELTVNVFEKGNESPRRVPISVSSSISSEEALLAAADVVPAAADVVPAAAVVVAAAAQADQPGGGRKIRKRTPYLRKSARKMNITELCK